MEPGKAAAKAAFLFVRNHHICLNRQRINFGTSFDARAWFSVQQTEKRMTKLRLLGAAALALSSALASPVRAQEVIYNPGYCAQFYPNANCQNKGPGNPYTGDYQRRTIYQNSYNRRADDPNWNNGWHDSYAARNGFVCQPGTWFKGEDGRRHICQ
jgi:hypothetical protein